MFKVDLEKVRGTRDQIASIGWIIEKARELQKNIYFRFIVYAKSFDCVDDNKLWKILKELRDTKTPYLHSEKPVCSQDATVRIRHRTMDWFTTGKGLGQGCILSPCLFNFYAEYIM